jgi:DNA-binding TFAR19-related protein (PDSD5 family)
MLKLKRNNTVTGRFYIRKKLLQFPCMEDMITDEDIMDLFKGLIELVKRSTEIKIERKYETLIDVLKCELRNFKQNN